MPMISPAAAMPRAALRSWGDARRVADAHRSPPPLVMADQHAAQSA